MRFKTYILLFCFIAIWSIKGQNITFDHYNDSDGLSHSSVRHIVQDKYGFLWLGTFSGLNRFDGYEFKTFTSSDSGNNKLLNDDITALKLDNGSNNLWIGTRNGLTRLNLLTNTFTTFLPDVNNNFSLPDKEIRSVYIDKFNRIWVGTKNRGLYLFEQDVNKFTKVPLKDFYYIKAIFEDNSGNIWIGSYETASIAKITLDDNGNISEIDDYTIKIPNSTEINPYVNFIYEDAKKDIFVGTREGLYKFDKSEATFKNLTFENEDVKNKLGTYFISVARSPNGRYWVGTLGGLLVCDTLEEIGKGEYQWYYSVLSDNASIVDNLISSLYFDASGVLWIGTEDGLDKYDPFKNQFKVNKDISKYIDNQLPRIRGFTKSVNNEVIVATRHDGLFISREGEFVPLYNNGSDLASIYSKDGNTIYCGLWNGKILRYNYTKTASQILDLGFNSAPIFSVIELDGKLIVCSFGEGVKIFEAKSLKQLDHILHNYEVNNVVSHSDGKLWFATENGVVNYNFINRNVTSFNQDQATGLGLPHDNVSDILSSSNGQVWAATRKGLGVYNPDTNAFIEVVDEISELKGRWITDILEDTKGNLWLNMNNNRMAKYHVETNEAHIYNISSGNRLDVFSSSGFYNFNDSVVYLAGKNGVIYFEPYNIDENKWTPKPVITEFRINNKPVLPGLTVNGQVPLESNINYSKSITLNYANRNFSIQFSVPSYTNERLNKFKYKLEGFDENWIESGSSSRVVQYTNLPSGTYNFKIKSSNNENLWSAFSSYTIEILPHFWLSYKGQAIIVFILGIAFYFTRQQIRSRIKLRRELLTEKVKRERDEKLNNEKLRFFTNISHELRTPLSLILGPVKQLMDYENSTDYHKNKAGLILHNANRLLRLVNQILDFRRAETGEIKLKVFQTDVLPDTQDIFYSFMELAQSKNINLNFNIEEEKVVCWIDMDKYKKILYNLLSNAIKFTNNYGNVDLFIGFSETNEKLILEVSDDGIGIPKESIGKIFSRFYQASNSKENTTGTGIGLSLVKALVTLHKGTINVRSAINEGSIFTVELPIAKSSYNEDEISSFIDSKKQVKTIEQTYASEVNNYSKKIIQNTDVKNTILVIDDNPELRNYLIDFLSGDYKVYGAENGKEGLELCYKVKPVLCVVDVMMPEMNGFEFVQALKNDENISHTAIVLLTALAENENKIKGFKIGVDGYLVKPFDPALLKSRIDNIIKIHFDLKKKFSGEAESDVITLAHSQIDIDLITKVKSIIEKNLENPELTPNFICSEIGLSSSKLYRKITQLTDLSPNEFIRTLRLKKSAKLLKTKNHNVSEVANMVGFNDPYYFSRCFKKQFGYAPSRLIK
ncbi:hybrid sensor histidine kinase/response regulator transcription factor [Seonamhaeicola sp.]|uniref:hybrid sensor histidine kinase/response regulator transcription factor n=1 Tax=Seonamhaeicola sp. TaxID=1912245 RepID=UPI0026156771|nr:hybrid sensor histidine kinase/response regulator transcription factor [Seonamhaeicola sp.]